MKKLGLAYYDDNSIGGFIKINCLRKESIIHIVFVITYWEEFFIFNTTDIIEYKEKDIL